MRIFLTGATGFVGSAIVPELLSAGHQVLGLARSDASSEKLQIAGAQVHRGDLEDLGSLQSGAAACDAVIHTGFIHDFARFKEVCEIDRVVIGAIGEALAGTNKPFLITSGTAMLQHGAIGKETDTPPPGHHPRMATEEATNALVAKGVHVAGVRLSPSVHGEGDIGFVPMLIKLAREKGVSAYIGDGLNRWPAVHRYDAARLYRLIVESDFTNGARFHAVGEEGVPFRDIAAVIGKHLNIPVVGKTGDEATAHFGWLSSFVAMDNPTSARHTMELLNWQPSHLEIVTDIDGDYYYKS